MFEYLLNTIIFFLAGALVGHSLLEITPEDYFHLIVIYVILTLLRGGLIFASRPILAMLGKKSNGQYLYVSVADALVMTWGGLRGAVGSALGILVKMERANGKIDSKTAERVLFYVGGVAF